MDTNTLRQDSYEDVELPETGRSFLSLDISKIGRAMLAQSKRVHSYTLKARRLRCEDPLRIHFIANNNDVVEFLRDGERLDLSHYDDSLKAGGNGATFFITGDKVTREIQWEIFDAALKKRPEIQRYLEDAPEQIEFYDLIKEQAEMAVQEAIVEIYNRRDKPSFFLRAKGYFGMTTRKNEVDIIREYGLVVSHIFVRDFLGLNIPGRSLYSKTQKFYLWIGIMFANLFVNPGGRNTLLNGISTVVSKIYRRQILKSYRKPKHGTILHRLKMVKEDDEVKQKYSAKDQSYEDYVVNIIMELAGSFQYLTGSSFGNIIKTIDEKESIGFGFNEIPTLIKKINENPRAWIDEYLRHNSPTNFIFRKAKKAFVIDDTDILPGDLLCLITSEAAKDEDVFGPKDLLLTPEKSASLCPYHTHFGSPDVDPTNGRPKVAHHPCFGQYWGRTILQSTLEGLLYFRWLETAKGASFKTRMKVFPSYKMTFAKEKKSQQFISILSEIPKDSGDPKSAQITLEALGHKKGDDYKDLGLSHLVHFMSGHVICGRENLPPKLPFNLRLPFIAKDEPDYLVWEISIDGTLDDFLRTSPPDYYKWMADFYKDVGITSETLTVDGMRERLFDDHVTLQQSIWPSLFHGKSTNGLPFSGTLGLNSARIRAEDEIAKEATKLVNDYGYEKRTFHGRLHVIRRKLRKGIIEGAISHPGNLAWVLGGSEAPHFSESQDDSWVEKDHSKTLSIFDYLQLAWKLLPRVLLAPVLIIFGLLAATFYENPSPTTIPLELVQYSSAKSFAFLMAAVFLAGLLSMVGRRFSRRNGYELGDMFIVTTFYLGFLVFFNSWATVHPKTNFHLWDYPGLGLIPEGVSFPITIGTLGVLICIFQYTKLTKAKSKYQSTYRPASKAIGLLILWFLICTSLYLHLFWMLPGQLTGDGSYLAANRFISGRLMDHLFYPVIHASVITLTVHAYRKSFHNPACPLMNPFNTWLFIGFVGLILLCTLFPIKSIAYVIDLARDISVFTFLIPLLISTTLLVVFRFLTPATAARGSKNSNFIREILGWGVITSVFINSNSNIRDFWGNLFKIEPQTGKEIDAFLPQIIAITKAFVIAFPITLVMVFTLVLLLQRFSLATSEHNNTPHDSDPGIENMKKMMSRENAEGFSQNHMVSVQRLLPEWFRIRILLPLSFHVIRRMLTTGIIRPGFLGNVGTVHFARWIHLPRTRNYAFLSNYDGSFESYLEDFVTKVNAGLNAAWSHCVGFPRVKNVFVGGTKDGDRFKRWARGSTRPTPFWYSAYPELTVEVIRRNALIRDGLVRARSASEAEAWFDLFNSTTRPEHALQTDQIQSFMFGGAKHLTSGCCLVLQTIETEFGYMSDYKGFLKKIENRVTYGQNKPKDSALYFAVSNVGVRSLLSETKALETRPWQGDQSLNNINETDPTWFAPPFVLGMDNDERARVLGDSGDSDRINWEWGSHPNEGLHELGVLLIYASNDEMRNKVVQDIKQDLRASGVQFREISFETHLHGADKNKDMAESKRGEINEINDQLVTEPFGFVDGVSNPIIRGTTRAAKNPNSIHVVNPGEFILGYRDNRGYFPASPQVEASEDIHRLLPALPNQQPQKYPRFGERNSDSLRDLGRNGSYLVIRQLEQNVEKYREVTLDYAKGVLKKLNKRTAAKIPVDRKNITTMQSIVQAKMMGRWHDGQSLVTRPSYLNEFYNSVNLEVPTKASTDSSMSFLHEDNEYLFGRDDPQGYACPFGSHVRRANPRDSLDPNNPKELEVSNRHRLLRRGRAYNDKKTGAKGTFFMCLNSDIDRQFEFVQQSWINGQNFHSLRDEFDPISTNKTDFTIQCPGANYQFGIESFVTVKGGGYFFMPSKDALLYFTKNGAKAQSHIDEDFPNYGMATTPAS